MISPKILNSIGLLSDIIGILIISKFGLPIDLATKGVSSCLNIKDVMRKKKYRKISEGGLILIFLGFLLQLISNWF